MKTVLIVDDDQGFLLSLQEMCKGQAGKFQVIMAGNGKEALDALNDKTVDLVVTDLKMPEMDGFELISQISKQNAIIPVIAMTAFGTPEMEDRLKNLGAFQYIEKPIDFNLLLKKIDDGLAAGSKGHVTGISLPSFLQLVELDHKTCTITATAANKTGILFFEGGALINAYTEPLEGLDAAYEIISWEHAEIEIYNFCQNRKKIIEAPLGFILIEGARFSDERKEKMAKEPQAQPQDTPPPAIADSELDQLDNLDFATTATQPTLQETATAPEPPPAHGTPQSLEEKINSTKGVNRMVLLTKDGSVLAHKNINNKEIKPFVSYVTMAADKIRNTLGYANLPKYIIMSQVQGEKLLIIPGPAVSVGIEIAPDVSPIGIAAAISPAIAEAQAK
ncbi:MAG: response regulator [Desulfobulbaceae bacterium]|nr:response regulator [Desulfobulbaceae bacterium]HIJ79869.1 response regulator [Deltaproteobacteria bacterium]